MSSTNKNNMEKKSPEAKRSKSNDRTKTSDTPSCSSCNLHPKIVNYIKDLLVSDEKLINSLSDQYVNELTQLLNEPCTCSPTMKVDILRDLLQFIEENKHINPVILDKCKIHLNNEFDDILKYSQDFKNSMQEVLKNIISIIFLQSTSKDISSSMENNLMENDNNELTEPSRNINVLSDSVFTDNERKRSEHPLPSNLSSNLLPGSSQNDENIEFVIGDNAVIKNQHIACECRPHEYGAAVPLIYSNISYITPQIQATNEPEQQRVSQQNVPPNNEDNPNNNDEQEELNVLNNTSETIINTYRNDSSDYQETLDIDENIHEIFENRTYLVSSVTMKLESESLEKFISAQDVRFFNDPERKLSSEEQLLKISRADSDLMMLSTLSDSVDEIYSPNNANRDQEEAEEEYDDDDDEECEETDNNTENEAASTTHNNNTVQTKSIKRCPKEFTLQKLETFSENYQLVLEPDIKAENKTVTLTDANVQKKSSDVINIKSATECPYQSQVILVDETRNVISQPLKYTAPQIFTVVNLPLTFFNLPNKINSSIFIKSTVGFVLRKPTSDIVLEKLSRSLPQIPSKLKFSVSMVQINQREVVNVLKENVSKTARLKQEQICNRIRRNPSSKRNAVITH